MPLFVKVIPLRAGTGEPDGDPRMLRCPGDVEPDTILPFLTQRLGEAIDTVWTSTEHHEHLVSAGSSPAQRPTRRKTRSSSRACRSSSHLTERCSPCSKSKPTSDGSLPNWQTATGWTPRSSISSPTATTTPPGRAGSTPPLHTGLQDLRANWTRRRLPWPLDKPGAPKSLSRCTVRTERGKWACSCHKRPEPQIRIRIAYRALMMSAAGDCRAVLGYRLSSRLS